MKLCIVDERISYKCERGIMREGFRVIKLPPCPTLPAPMASHTDMVMFCHGGNIIASADYCERAPYIFTDIREYSDTKITLTDEVQGDCYPHDALFNALAVGNIIFLKKDTASRAVLDYAESRGFKTVDTRQGYPACTVLAFGNRAITADEGMARSLSAEGIEVLKIQAGGVSLPPYEYGFIGGASGTCEKTVYFLGDIMRHPNAESITDFISGAGYAIRSLSDEELCDLGGIRFILA